MLKLKNISIDKYLLHIPMCFIAGSIGFGENYGEFMTQKSRGPDAQSYVRHKNYEFMFGLLPIASPKGSAMQPFYHYRSDGSVITVMCNGEIFNWELLREEFPEYPFISDSDCEVLLPLYLKYGFNFLHKLNGDFAIAIFDVSETSKKLYLARDRVGTRSLYFVKKIPEITFIQNQIVGVAFSSNKSGIAHLGTVENFEPSTTMEIDFKNIYDIQIKTFTYFVFNGFEKLVLSEEEIKTEFRNKLIKSVEMRIPTNKQVLFGFLLSGGIDSGLVCRVGIEKCVKNGMAFINVFTIGTDDCPDVIRSKITIQYLKNLFPTINIIHTVFNITNEECLDALKKMPKILETFDVTTNRAGTMQFLATQKIKQMYPNLTVLMLGDFADELYHGYRYFHNAPTPELSEFESMRLMIENHNYDLKRVEKCLSFWSVEGRCPHNDVELLTFYQKIPATYKWCGDGKIEKKLVRDSFAGFLPDEILYAPKVAFSDGTTNLNDIWYKTIEKMVELKYSDEDFENRIKKYAGFLTPHTKEALFYHEIFDEYFPNQYGILDKYWLPSWIDCGGNPSATVLDGYVS